MIAFRFLHHLDDASARVFLGEVARVARRYIVVSFFHPISTHGLRRRVVRSWRGRPSTRHAVAPRTLTTWMADFGFVPTGWAAQLPYLDEFWVAAFERSDSVR